VQALQRRCSFRSLLAQAAWPALPARARARPALQLLLRDRRLPVASDAAVAALPRTQGKKLGLTLVSEKTGDERIYRISDKPAAANGKSKPARKAG
jgi:hypothetical protein